MWQREARGKKCDRTPDNLNETNNNLIMWPPPLQKMDKAGKGRKPTAPRLKKKMSEAVMQ